MAETLKSIIEREVSKLDGMDDSRLLQAMTNSVYALKRGRDIYESASLEHALDLIKRRLTEDLAAHPDLMPVAIVMSRVPLMHLRDTRYIADKLCDVLEAHIASTQINPWKAFVP